MSNIVSEELKQAQLYREIKNVDAALETAQTVLAWFGENDINERTRAQAEMSLKVVATQLGFTSISQLFGEFDVVADTEVAMEGLSDVPARVYDAIAKLIQGLIRRARMLFTAVSEMLFQKNKEAADKLEAFQKRVEEAEETIKRFGLEPGSKMTPEEKESLDGAGAHVFTDPTGRVVDKAMISEDVTILIPPAYRGDVNVLSKFVLNGKYGDLVSQCESTLQFFNDLTSAMDRTAYERVINTVMTMRDIQDFDWILNKGIKEIEQSDLASVAKLRLRGKHIKSPGRKLLGDVWPSFIPERSGLIKMHTLMFSYTEGKLDTNQPSRLPKGLPKLSYRDLEELRAVTAKLDSKREQIANEIRRSKDNLETFGAGGGDVLRDAAEDLKRYHNGRNDKDIQILQEMIRSIPKSHMNAVSYLEASERYLRTLVDALNVYVIMIAGQD